MKKTLFLKTGWRYFAQWLEDYTFNAPFLRFQSEGGRISLQTARGGPDHNGRIRLGMDALYLAPLDEHTQVAYPLGDIIRFTVIPLADDRIEVRAECLQPGFVGEYVEALIQAIYERWPEARDAVNAYLGVEAQQTATPEGAARRREGRHPKVNKDECVRLYTERKVGVKMLAKRYNVSLGRIYQVLREQGVELRQ